MKVILFMIIISGQLFSQKSSFQTWSKESPNGIYRAILSGQYYEGFVGDQKLEFFCHDSLLFEKVLKRRGLHLPEVSNNGEVVITRWNEFSIYSISDSLLWDYKLINETFCNPFSEHDDIINCFSKNSEYYFAVIYSNENRKFSLISNSIPEKKELWRINLDTYYAGDLIPFENFIVLHDFYAMSMNYINKLYVFDFDGNVLWEYEIDLINNSFKNVVFDKTKNKISLIFDFGNIDHIIKE